MINLSSKVTGDELTAAEWDNHSKELENVVTKCGYPLSTNQDDLIKSIETINKYNTYQGVYDNTDTYTCTRLNSNIDIEVGVNTGYLMYIKFDKTNSVVNPKININGVVITLKNSDSNIPISIIKVDSIYGFVYDGSDFITVGNGLVTVGGGVTSNADGDIDKLVKNAGYTSGRTNDTDLTNAVDRFSKMLYYQGNKSGNVWVCQSRLGITTETSLKKGLVLFVRMNYANNNGATPKLKYNGVTKDIRNNNGEVINYRAWINNEILGLIFNGTYWQTIKRLSPLLSTTDPLNAFKDETNHSTIANYVSVSTVQGGNPHFDILSTIVHLNDKSLTFSFELKYDHDGYHTNTSAIAGTCSIDVKKILKDVYNLDVNMVYNTMGSCVMRPYTTRSGSASSILPNVLMSTFTTSDKYYFVMGKAPLSYLNKTVKRWVVHASFTVGIKHV